VIFGCVAIAAKKLIWFGFYCCELVLLVAVVFVIVSIATIWFGLVSIAVN